MGSATISSKGQISIPKKIREKLKINSGDKFVIEITRGNIVLKPVVTITVPKDQEWFWKPEIQNKIKKAEENFKDDNYKTYEPDEFIKELENRDSED